ncbi:hypothetical protein H4S06_006470, partial [Coemansia sp. BCRC 34490]
LLGDPLLKRTFMGGHIFMPSMTDTALCQCYFSSHILDVLRHLTFSHAPGNNSSSNSRDSGSRSRSRGSGSIGGGSSNRGIHATTASTPRSQEMEMEEEADAIVGFKPGKLSLLHVPARFVGKRYDTLVLTLMKQHAAVPLGLYRIVSHRGQAFAAVMCNPPPYLPLLPSDAVYVLGPDIRGWSHYADALRALHIATPPGAAAAAAAAAATATAASASSQSRHTVYSHNTDLVTTAKSTVRFHDDTNADADASDDAATDHASAPAQPLPRP